MKFNLRTASNYLFYRRPDFVSPVSPEGPITELDSSTIRNSATSTRGIPERLSFDKILNHETCPVSFSSSNDIPELFSITIIRTPLTNYSKPCTTLDFYYYLNHKVHCAETLQFYLWLRDYTHRFNAPGIDTSTQPVWTAANQEEAIRKFQREVSTGKKIPMSTAVREVFRGTDFGDHLNRRRENSNPPSTGSTGNSTLVGTAVAPWEIPEKEDEANDSNGSPGQEERDTAIARSTYLKQNLHYPCSSSRLFLYSL